MGSIVQLANGIAQAQPITTISATFASTATLGNVIVVALTLDKNNDPIQISGFSTQVVVRSGTSATLAYCYKVSDGTEDTITWTWTNNSGNEGSITVFELTGVNSTPNVVASANSGGSSTTSQTSGTTASTTGTGLALALWGIDTGNNVDAGRAYTNSFIEQSFLANLIVSYNTAGLATASRLTVDSETVESTFSTTDSGDQIAAAVLVFGDAPTANIGHYLSDATDTTARVKCRVASGLSTTLEYSINSDFTASTTTAAETPIAGDDYIAEFNLSSLTSNTTYYYRAIEDGVTDSRNGTFKTAVTAGTPANITFAFAGDAASSNNSQTFTNITDRGGLDFFWHLGDIHYDDITVNTESLYWTAYKTVLSQSNQRDLYESLAIKYTWDDHDYSDNNSDGTSASKVAAAAAFRQYMSTLSLNNTSSGSIEQAWTTGRVRCIALDSRYERGVGTILGSTQKTWFLSELTSANSDPSIELVVVSVSVPWIATAVTDSWSDAPAERTEISDHIWSLGLENNICFICADAHMITHDDGTNNTFDTSNQAGWPVYHSAPLGQTGSNKGGPYTGTVFVGDVDGQYSVMSIVDNTTNIDVTVRGYDKNDIELYNHTFSTPTQPAAPAIMNSYIDIKIGI